MICRTKIAAKFRSRLIARPGEPICVQGEIVEVSAGTAVKALTETGDRVLVQWCGGDYYQWFFDVELEYQ